MDYILSKTNKSVGILFKLNKFLPLNILLSLYNTLILPYFNYGITCWHNAPHYALNRLVTSQKKAVRAICSLEYNAHTNNYFRENKILKLNNIYDVNLCATLFSYLADPHSHPIANRFVRNSQLHNYDTRNRENFVIPRYSRSTSQSCFLYQASAKWNEVPPNIKDSHTVGAFRRKYKRYILGQY